MTLHVQLILNMIARFTGRLETHVGKGEYIWCFGTARFFHVVHVLQRPSWREDDARHFHLKVLLRSAAKSSMYTLLLCLSTAALRIL